METTVDNKAVMLIDDDAITNFINTKVIKLNFSFDVHDYVNAQLALEQLMQWCQSFPEKLPFIIFLDINMPVMDGWEFLEEFQKLPSIAQQKSRIFMLTSSIDGEDIEKAKTYPVVSEFISKPLTPDKLRNLIQD
ncbi:MAG: response regulator [Cyclobacteriaceae bacterium]|nr:response regulator [Cyclobacteriaceae bacterium]